MNVLVLGDSFAFGHGCSDRVFYYDFDNRTWIGERIDVKPPSEFCWASLLQQEFKDKIQVTNIATVGRSMQGMFADLVQWLKGKIKFDLVIFTGTVRDRVEMPMVHDHNKSGSWGLSWETSLPSIDWQPDDFANAKQIYVKHLYNDAIADQMAFSALLGAHSLTQINKIKFLWSVPAICFSDQHLNDLLEPISDCEIPDLMRYDFSYRQDSDFNKNFLCVDGHTNDLGHRIYYEKEVRPAVKRILGV
jgi:hypothetical protein